MYFSHMRNSVIAAVLLSTAVFFASCARADDLTHGVISVSHTDSFTSGAAIHLDNSRGEVTIEGWDRPGIEVIVTKSTAGIFDAKQHPAADQLLGHFNVKAESKDSQIVISTELPKKGRDGVLIDYLIHAPRGTKVEVNHGDGGLTVTGLASDLQATLRRGQVTLTLPGTEAFAIDAHTGIGDVYSEFEGTDRRRRIRLTHDFTGAAGSATHKIKVNLEIGDIVLLKEVALTALK
jgi:hypothetical protein